MLTCSACQKTSALDAAYCRYCGAALDPDALKQARIQNDALVEDGRRLLVDHRHEEALLVAEEVLRNNPASVAAYGLQGDVHEARGDLAKALAAYEKVTELDPDSKLDRIKLSFLRQQLGEVAAEPGYPRQKAALAAAAATVVMLAGFFGAGKFWLGQSAQASPKPNESRSTTGTQQSFGSAPAMADPYLDRGQNSTPSQPNRTETTPANARQEPRPLTNSGSSARPILPPPEVLPVAPLRPGDFGGLESRPVEGSGTSRPVQPSQSPPSNPTPRDPDPAPVGESKPKPNRRPVIEITPSTNAQATAGGTDRVNSATRTGSDPAAAGRAAMASGDFAEAARQYELALAQGADVASTNQRLAQAYERLGRKSDAAAAYRRAIAAYESRVASGGSERDKASLETCRNALKLLGG